jgi:hypothetical protein
MRNWPTLRAGAATYDIGGVDVAAVPDENDKEPAALALAAKNILAAGKAAGARHLFRFLAAIEMTSKGEGPVSSPARRRYHSRSALNSRRAGLYGWHSLISRAAPLPARPLVRSFKKRRRPTRLNGRNDP